MKVLWGTSLDPIQDGDRFDGEVFAAAETDDTLLRALDDAVEQEERSSWTRSCRGGCRSSSGSARSCFYYGWRLCKVRRFAGKYL